MREGIGQNVDGHHSDRHHTALPFIGGVVLTVPCRVPENFHRIRYSTPRDAHATNVFMAMLKKMDQTPGKSPPSLRILYCNRSGVVELVG